MNFIKQLNLKNEIKEILNTKIIIALITMVLVLAPSVASFAGTEETPKALTRDKNETVMEEAMIADTITLKATSDTFGQVDLSWEKISDATGYIVYRYNQGKNTYEPIKTIEDENQTTYTDKNVESNIEYSYQVTPIISLPEMTNSTIASVKTPADKVEINVSTDENTAAISWDSLQGSKSYEIYRSTSATGDYSKVTATSSTSYTDDNLKGGQKYYYKVRANNGDDVSEMSNVADTEFIQKNTAATVVAGDGKLLWPLPSVHSISSPFGNRTAPTWGATATHDGIDITCSQGSNVVAALDGTVETVESNNSARGIYVIIDHGHGLKTLYQHLSDTNVKVGDTVKRGDVVAYAGSTGVSTGTHLHFEVWINEKPVDPEKYL